MSKILDTALNKMLDKHKVAIAKEKAFHEKLKMKSYGFSEKLTVEYMKKLWDLEDPAWEKLKKRFHDIKARKKGSHEVIDELIELHEHIKELKERSRKLITVKINRKQKQQMERETLKNKGSQDASKEIADENMDIMSDDQPLSIWLRKEMINKVKKSQMRRERENKGDGGHGDFDVDENDLIVAANLKSFPEEAVSIKAKEFEEFGRQYGGVEENDVQSETVFVNEPRIEEIIEEDMPRNDDVLRRYAKSGCEKDSQSQIVELLVYSRKRKAAANDDTAGESSKKLKSGQQTVLEVDQDAGVNQDIEDNAPLMPNIDYNDDVKLQHLHYLIKLLPPFLRQIHKEQEEEIGVEADARGISPSEVQIVGTKCDPAFRVSCNRCSTSILDLHRYCSDCDSEICLTCCQESRNSGQLKRTRKSGPNSSKWAFILCGSQA